MGTRGALEGVGLCQLTERQATKIEFETEVFFRNRPFRRRRIARRVTQNPVEELKGLGPVVPSGGRLLQRRAIRPSGGGKEG